jgi:hypothetical protein
MPTKHCLICAKTAMKHFSKALVYDSGNRQRAARARAMCMRCIAVKSSVPQGRIVCFDMEVGWCVGIAVILVVGRE